ncbi:MAG: type II toxin-antitoxin system prevent-host-death family antitoxin [Burkholderiales bacterium]
MSKIGAYEAKTHFPALLERVQKGEKFVITKHGRPVAELTPYSGHDADAAKAAVAEMRKLRDSLARKGLRLKDILKRGESIRDLTHDGHRF